MTLPQTWTNYLGLSYRTPPELFQSLDEVVDVPHAGALRDCFSKLGLSAVFCVQNVPTVALLVQDTYDQSIVTETHAALWNQGLASLFLVISDDTLRVFSLVRRTAKDSDEEFIKRCLIETLNATSDALALKGLISGAESGRLWESHSEFFPSQERVDNVLLNNLSESYRRLCDKGLSSDASQALLMQTMFVSYLEDRGIITPEYILEKTNNAVSNFGEVLSSGKPQLLNELFDALRFNFNGNLFVAPCSFEQTQKVPILNDQHLSILARFQLGKEEMAGNTGQLRFWGYDFKYIPVELISAVYDRFLGENESERRKLGAYYTPMFLADTVISQIWDTLTPAIKDKGTFLDPACGSGVFLVRMFQRLCDHWRATHNNQKIRWDSLLNILKRFYGWDVNGHAVRVTVFSLYIALLEQVDPRDFTTLTKKERLLPELWGKTFVECDFFDNTEDDQTFDVILGNPPWASRHGADSTAERWCNESGFPIPSKEAAWGFTWKALSHITSNGLVAFLLPAMGFLHNHSNKGSSLHHVGKP
ncbi:HsdM family class I SAM-dependent methyltransferase [Desulfogranum japonicum]|uniref:HsdM family class I SAM-dependent methyltransferase n=1 Tax=Desulfogranum japonicum TaxID=231447 RepID=UPI000414C705|nr:N-6 DNA methylase [Desulfogranum japonicum]